MINVSSKGSYNNKFEILFKAYPNDNDYIAVSIFQLVVDGGLSNNLLSINQQTIKVSPFAGDSDICPLESKWGPQYHRAQPQKYEDVLGSISLLNLSMSFNLTNIKRLVGMVWPMSPDQLVNLANQGYDDALRFLITRGKLVVFYWFLFI